MTSVKYIAFLAFCLLSASVYCQSSSISVFTGIDYSKIKFFDFTASGHENILNEQFSFPSVIFGLEANHKLSKKIKAQISFHYTFKKNILQSDFGFDPSLYTESLEFKSIVSRFGFNYRLVKKLHVGLGIQSRFIFGAQENIANGSVDRANKTANNLGVFLLTRYDFNSFVLEMIFSRGANMHHNDLKYRFFDTVENIQAIEIKLGYKLVKK